MKKSERINDMIPYLSDKGIFNLKDLMVRYQISKRTALRDIQSLEALGLPIYSELGRYGKYGVLDNKLLSPILFNMDEVLTLYFSMIALNNYQTTPFHIQVDKLNQKFNKCLSLSQSDQITKLKKVLSFHTNHHQNPCNCLNEILDSILENKELDIDYQRGDTITKYDLQFFRVSARFGQWYANAYDLSDQCLKVFRCDKIIITGPSTETCYFDTETLLQQYHSKEISDSAITYSVTVDQRGKDIFLKESYENMTMEINDTIIIHGSYELNEVGFIASYFINYGTSIKSIQPIELKDAIKRQLEVYQKHFDHF